MPTSVSLSPYFETFIREQIESGRYNNTSEVIRAGLRALEEQEQKIKLESLRNAVTAGINSGESKSAAELFGRLTNKYKKIAAGEQSI